MKKILLVVAFAVFTLSNVNAQSKFGVMAGYASVQEKFSMEGMSDSYEVSRFFVGGVVAFTISERFHIQPEILYANSSESSLLYIPVLAKYMVSDKFGVLVGPQANFLLEKVIEDLNSLGVDLTFGANYKITENFFGEARYGLELTNRVSNISEAVGAKDRFNTLHIGVGYMF